MADRARILVVDDEVNLVEAIQTALSPYYHVLTAYSGKAAFEMLARQPVDLLILDHRLPDMDGMVILRFLKPIFPTVPVIYMTAYGSEDLAVEFYDSGGRKYLRKPFAIPEFLGRVDAYLAARRQSGPTRRPVLEPRDGAPVSSGNGPRDPRIDRAIAHIEHHLPGTSRVHDVARAVGLSKSQLGRAFKRATGYTIQQFILRRRMAHGIALLCDLKLSTKEVAALIGFKHPGNFGRAFHQVTNWTPSEFRASLRARLGPRP